MSSTETLYLLYLSTGFTIGFGHCIGMCGPIVVTFSLNLKNRSILIPHVLYHLGRIITYALLGSIVAATGSLTMVAAHLENVQKGVMIFAAALMMLMGFAMAGWLPVGRIFSDHSRPGRWISKGFGRLLEVKSTMIYLPLGLLLGLLPCGPVYTALLGSARAGMEADSIYQGMLAGMGLMGAFGMGTVPALFIVARMAGMGWLQSRARVYKAGAVLMIVAGLIFLVKAVRY